MSTPQDRVPLRNQIDVSSVRMDGPAWDELCRLADNPHLPFSHGHLRGAVQYAEMLRRAATVLLNQSEDEHPELRAALELRLEGTGDAARDVQSHLIKERDTARPEQARKRAARKSTSRKASK